MAATKIVSLVADIRATNLKETTPRFWTDVELAKIAQEGAKDLWRAIVDLYDHHFVTIDSTNVTLAASSNQLTGMPTDCYRVVSIEPRVLGASSPNPGLIFTPKNWNSDEFRTARAQAAVDPNNREILYTVMNPGAPVGAPIIRLAPQVSAAVNITLVYNQTLGSILISGSNPIPGESDNALKAWMTAFALAKQREDHAPDLGWLAIYATEKKNLVQQLAQRQIQEPEVAAAWLGECYDGG